MGARTPQSIKDEIVELRRSLDAQIGELETRLPPLVKAARRAAVVAAGGGAGGSALYAVLRLRRRRARKEKAAVQRAAAPSSAPAEIRLVPKGGLVVAAGIAAVWAGVRLYEARLRQADGGSRRGDLRVVKGRGTDAAAGS